MNEDPALQEAIASLRDDWSAVLIEVPPQEEPEPLALDRLPLAYFQHNYLNMETCA